MTCMDPFVLLQTGSPGEGFTAHITHIVFMAGVDLFVSVQATDCSKGRSTYSVITHMLADCIHFMIAVTMVNIITITSEGIDCFFSVRMR